MQPSADRVSPGGRAPAPRVGTQVIEAELVSEPSALRLPTQPPERPITPELLAEVELVEPEPMEQPSAIGRLGTAIGSGIEWIFGAVTLIVALALLATYPVLQLLSLGYLLEATGRIGRTGRLPAGFVGVRKAARVGSIFFGTWLMLLPLRYVASIASAARLIEPGSPADRGWSAALLVLTVLIVAHVIGACSRGGRLRHFLRPAPLRLARQVFRRGAYAQARDAVWGFVAGLRLPYYFWLGLRGFAGGLIWLFLPITLLAAGRQVPLLGFVGGLALVLVLLYLPLVQAHFAAQNRFRAMFEVGRVRQLYGRAPLAFLMALCMTLLFALPLYLLKIEIIPREAAWLPSLVFVVFIFPARLITGWAYSLATRRPRPRHAFARHAVRLATLPVAALYVLIVYFTQYTSWHGMASLYEQHAFLVPVPFLGL